MLLHSQKIDAEAYVEYDTENDHHLLIEVPVELTDRILIEDIFEYILPTGVTYTFINVATHGRNEVKTTSAVQDNVDIEVMSDMQLSQVSNFDNLDPNDYENRSATSTGKVFSVDLGGE